MLKRHVPRWCVQLRLHVWQTGRCMIHAIVVPCGACKLELLVLEVLVLDRGVVVPVGESLTEIYQAEMQEFLG